jgi:hypothetical protein
MAVRLNKTVKQSVSLLSGFKQWGTAPWVTSYTSKAIFPISFSNTSYIVVATGRIEDDSKAVIGGVLYNHKETTGCILRGSEEKGPAAEYVAIGT